MMFKEVGLLVVLSVLFSCSFKTKKTTYAELIANKKKTSELEQKRIINSIPNSEKINIAFVGDVIIHERIRKREEKTGEGFYKIWENIQSYLQQADFVYANLEGPVAPEYGGATGFPLFNFPESIIPSLKNYGINIVSTANNHSLDRQAKGVRRTIENLNKYNLLHVGTVGNSQVGEEALELWWKITPINEFRVAWIACTEMTNGIRDKENQVLYCYKDREQIKTMIQKLKDQVDIIILTPHWGEEDTFIVESNRTIWAKKMLDYGATAVVGSHPHVVQKVEQYVTADQRQTVIAYSLGNFISNQPWTPNKASMILYLQFNRAPDQKIHVGQYSYIPLWTVRTIEKDTTSKYRIYPVWDIKKHEAGKIWQDQLSEDRRIKNDLNLKNFLQNSK